jgi:hypothetical protein
MAESISIDIGGNDGCQTTLQPAWVNRRREPSPTPRPSPQYPGIMVTCLRRAPNLLLFERQAYCRMACPPIHQVHGRSAPCKVAGRQNNMASSSSVSEPRHRSTGCAFPAADAALEKSCCCCCCYNRGRRRRCRSHASSPTNYRCCCFAPPGRVETGRGLPPWTAAAAKNISSRPNNKNKN